MDTTQTNIPRTFSSLLSNKPDDNAEFVITKHKGQATLELLEPSHPSPVFRASGLASCVCPYAASCPGETNKKLMDGLRQELIKLHGVRSGTKSAWAAAGLDKKNKYNP